MKYKFDTKKWYVAEKDGKYFHGELGVKNSLTGEFDSITWYDSESEYNAKIEELGLRAEVQELLDAENPNK